MISSAWLNSLKSSSRRTRTTGRRKRRLFPAVAIEQLEDRTLLSAAPDFEWIRQFGTEGPAIGPDHPDTLESMNNMASLLATCPDPKFRNPERAIALAQQVVKIRPKLWWGHWGTLGVARYRHGEWKLALAAFQKSRELSPKHVSFFEAMAHWQLGDKEMARRCLDKAVTSMTKSDLRFRAEAEQLMGIKFLPARARRPAGVKNP